MPVLREKNMIPIRQGTELFFYIYIIANTVGVLNLNVLCLLNTKH